MPKLDKKLRGIGGWLILFQIIVYLILLIDIVFLVSIITTLFPIIFNFIFLDQLVYAIMFMIDAIFIIFSLNLFYRKKKMFPRFMKISLWLFYAFFVYQNYNFAMSQPIRPTILSLIFSFLIPLAVVILLVSYLKRSKRVKNTFVK